MIKNYGDKPDHQTFWNNQFNLITAAALIGLIAGILLITFWPQGAGDLPALTTPSSPPTETTLPSPSPPPSQTSTSTPEALLTPPGSAGSASTPTPYTVEFNPDFGTLVLSIRKAQFYQLFAYQPFLNQNTGTLQGVPLTQLTSSEDHKIHPALSPDGNRLAYASDRDGSWDIYILNLSSGETSQFTANPGYEAYPSWSPDGQWLTFESYQGDNLEIIIQNAAGENTRINLTNHPGEDFSPNWSPQGRKISFISTRSGEKQILVADLDNPAEEKAEVLQGLQDTGIRHPTWSPDGQLLSWAGSSLSGYQEVYLWDSVGAPGQPQPIGSGSWPIWEGTGTLIYSVHETPEGTYLTAYPADPAASPLLMPPVKLPGTVMGISWAERFNLDGLQASGNGEPGDGGESWPYKTPREPLDPPEKQELLQLTGVQAPNPKLNALAAESFNALKDQTANQAGWDFLSVLRNAYLPLTTPLEPTGGQEWLYTGRGFEISDLPRQAGWMIAVKEDYGGQTFWRLYLRARRQDGSQGRPLKQFAWNFEAQFSGSSSAYEEGGRRADTLPEGYWIDFTDLALAYGWQRFPALTRWQTAYPQTRWQLFAYTQGLTWEQAMLEIYPDLALVTPTPRSR